MAKKDNNIKEYGVDLEKQYKDALAKVKYIEKKIKKRAKLVLDDLDDKELENIFPKYLLILIKKKEKEYVEQTEQLDMFEKRRIGAIEFNKLTDNEKWDALRAESQGKVEFIGTWHCYSCGEEDEKKPHRASPVSGAEVCCGNCDAMLTRRTGGGQSDPFNWELVEIIS